MQTPDTPGGHLLARVEEFAPVLAVVDTAKGLALQPPAANRESNSPFKLVLRLSVPGITLVVTRSRHGHRIPLACARRREAVQRFDSDERSPIGRRDLQRQPVSGQWEAAKGQAFRTDRFVLQAPIPLFSAEMDVYNHGIYL